MLARITQLTTSNKGDPRRTALADNREIARHSGETSALFKICGKVVPWVALVAAVTAVAGTDSAQANALPDQQKTQQEQDANQPRFEELRAAAHQKLFADIDAAGESFTAIEETDIAGLKSRLRSSVQKLDQRLSQNKKYGQDWREYLQWDALTTQLEAEQIDVETLLSIASRFDSGHVGLESPVFRNVARDLAALIQAERASQLADQPAALKKELQRLADSLNDVQTRPRSRSFKQLAASLEWFDRHGFAPELVQEVRHQYVQPNFYAHVSAELLTSGSQRTLHQEIPINERSGGVRISGKGVFTGTMDLELVPNTSQAEFRICFDGTFRTSTCGHRHPIGFTTRGVTTVAGTQHLYATGDGIVAEQAIVNADTSLRVTNVWSTFSRPVKNRIATRVGSKRIMEGKAASERQLSRKAEENFARQFESETMEMITEANATIANSLRVPLKASDIYPRELTFSTTRDRLLVQAAQAGPAQLGASTSPPMCFPQEAMTFSVHESLVNNTTATTLSNEQVESSQLAKVIEQIAGSVPEEFASHNGDTWTLKLYKSDPVEVHFDDGGLSIMIRCSGIRAGDQEYNVPFQVSAAYAGSIRGDAVVFTRQGGVTMRSPGVSALGSLTEEQARSRAAIQARFEMLLAEEMDFSTRQLPFELPPGVELEPTQFRSVDGWMIIALDTKPRRQ